MKYYLIAGEASGDLHASNLMKSISVLDGDAGFRCFGGDLMESAGGVLVKHYRELAYMGFWPVLTHLGKILGSARECFDDISAWKPDAVILVDYPGFNLSIARMVHARLGIPVFYYISPKLWAWKGYRLRSIRRNVDAMFSILPFETDYFAARGYRVEYVGNPCVDAVAGYLEDNPDAPDTRDARVVAILAGSRKQEIRRNLPRMLDAACSLDGCVPVIAAAPGIEDSYYSRFIEGKQVKIERGRTYGVLRNASAALVTSGTATLETALLRVPQVVCYRLPMGIFTRLFGKALLHVRFVSLVNLIAGREVVPELLADGMNVENLKKTLVPLLDDSDERRLQLEGYGEVMEKLGPAGASDKAARGMVERLKR